jgi:hypothetical protein
MTVSRSKDILRECNLVIRNKRLFYLAAHFKWQHVPGPRAPHQAMVQEGAHEVAAREDQPELARKQCASRKEYADIKRDEYTRSIESSDSGFMKFYVPVCQLVNLAVRGYPRTKRKELHGKAQERRFRSHSYKNYVTSHIGSCQGKKKDCFNPGHLAWRLLRLDVRDKNTWKSRKSLLRGAASRATYPNSTAIRGKRQGKRTVPHEDKEQHTEDEDFDEDEQHSEGALQDDEGQEVDITDDRTYPKSRLVEAEAKGPSERSGGEQPQPTALSARTRAQEDKKRGYIGCALQEVITELVESGKIVHSNDPYIEQVRFLSTSPTSTNQH